MKNPPHLKALSYQREEDQIEYLVWAAPTERELKKRQKRILQSKRK